MRHKDKKAKDKITVEIRQQDDFKPGFAAYLEGSLNCSGKAQVILNVSNLMGIVAAKELAPKDIPGVVADCIFHEFLHVIEEWAGQAFSEKRIHRLVEKYRKLYEKDKIKSGANKNRKKQLTTAQGQNADPDFYPCGGLR